MTYDTMLTTPFLAGDFGVYSNNFRQGDTDMTLHADTFYIAMDFRHIDSFQASAVGMLLLVIFDGRMNGFFGKHGTVHLNRGKSIQRLGYSLIRER